MNEERRALLLVGHGSRDPEGNEEFLEFVGNFQGHSRRDRIYAAFVELATPTIEEGIHRCVQEGADEVVILPLLFFAAGHAKTDIPREVRRARLRYPGVVFYYGAPLGIHPSLLEVLDQRVRSAEEGVTSMADREETAVLLIGRGSSDPDANGEMLKIARLYWERSRYGWVETCFIGVTRPDLPSGIRRCIALGARRIVAVPYFIFTGVLIKRIRGIVGEMQGGCPGVEMVTGDYLGRHPAFLSLVVERERQVLEGPILMNCDLCKHRDPSLSSPTEGDHAGHHSHHHGH